VKCSKERSDDDGTCYFAGVQIGGTLLIDPKSSPPTRSTFSWIEFFHLHDVRFCDETGQFTETRRFLQKGCRINSCEVVTPNILILIPIAT
jgi:hypothetical protein